MLEADLKEEGTLRSIANIEVTQKAAAMPSAGDRLNNDPQG